MTIKGAVVLLLLAAAGCAGVNNPDPASSPGSAATAPKPAAADDAVVAFVGDQPIRMNQLVEPMKQADGLKFLLRLAVLQEAKGLAQRNGYVVGPADIEHERLLVLEELRRELSGPQVGDSTTQQSTPSAQQVELALASVLQKSGISEPEFRINLQINAYVRKMCEKRTLDSITDDEIHQRFNLLYGETVRVRAIWLRNLQEVAEARRRLQTDDFAAVAAEMSQEPNSARNFGELPPFSLQSPDYSPTVKEAAFKLNRGEVSDPVEFKGWFLLIKLIERIPPKAVKFDDVKDYVTNLVRREKVQAAMQDITNRLGASLPANMQIKDDELKRQYEALIPRATAPVAPPAPADATPTPADNGPNWITVPSGATLPSVSGDSGGSGAVIPSVPAGAATAPGESP